MKIRSLFALTCLTTALACGGDDGGDDAADSGSDSTVSTTMTTTESTTMTTTVSTTDTTETGDTGTETGDTGTETGDTGTDTGPEDSGTTGAGTSCELYCTTYMTNCADGQGGSEPYMNEMACLNACGDWDEGTVGDMSGDTVQCRIYHATAAAGDPGTHCPHSQEEPDGGCV